MDRSFAEAILAMLDDCYELGQCHELERFDQVLFFARARCARVAFAASVRSLPTHSPPDEISGAFGTDSVSCLKDYSVAEVQDDHFGLFLAA